MIGFLFGAAAIMIFLVLVLFLLHVIECIWVYRDSLRRGYSYGFAFLALLGVFFFPFLGLLVYLLVRRGKGT
jgi:hypothetical protein